MDKNIPIIYYHSIAPSRNTNWFRSYLTLELKYFEEHLKYFAKSGYKYIFLKDLITISKDPDMDQGDKQVCLTFDDGYVDNFIYVYPLLKKYKAKATIFVNPVFVDKRPLIRKTLEDFWHNKAILAEINQWGFLSWDEMRLMEQSGFVDVQSHTLTHTKYFVSDKLVGFHHPGADCLYYIGNEYPEKLPYYIEDKEFEKLLPYGYPIFEQKSSMIARKVLINKSFIHSVIQSFNQTNWNQHYDFEELSNKIKPLYNEAQRTNSIIESQESEEEYKKRVYNELKESKDIIEKELNKEVEICCWPHGDNNEFAHNTALEIRYKATMQGNQDNEINKADSTRIPPRIGLSKSKNSLFLTRLKTNYKVKTTEKRFPYYTFNRLYNKIRYGLDT